jgi:hypothetical protein
LPRTLILISRGIAFSFRSTVIPPSRDGDRPDSPSLVSLAIFRFGSPFHFDCLDSSLCVFIGTYSRCVDTLPQVVAQFYVKYAGTIYSEDEYENETEAVRGELDAQVPYVMMSQTSEYVPAFTYQKNPVMVESDWFTVCTYDAIQLFAYRQIHGSTVSAR